MADIDSDFVHLARFALEGKREDAAALLRRAVPALSRRRPDLAPAAKELLAGFSRALGRGMTAQPLPLPVDNDSRLELLRREYPVVLPATPLWTGAVALQLNAIVEERRRHETLIAAGVEPTRSALLVGPPGVGKTLAARWLAHELARPFLILDLAAVMSSFLGKTGNNIRTVLEYARSGPPSVLLFDEFDAIAKRRDDSSDVGELKRLVNVLLQAVDDWPVEGILLAATNHPELLDPAVWRRFDRIVEFPSPDATTIDKFIKAQLPPEELTVDLVTQLRNAFAGWSFADIERELKRARRNSLTRDVSLRSELEEIVLQGLQEAPYWERLQAARDLARRGRSQRDVQRLTGVARDTQRKYIGRGRR